MAEKEHTTDSAAYGDVKSRKSFFESVFSDKSGKLPTRTMQGKNKTSPQTEKGQSHLAGNQSSTDVAKKDRDQGKEELHDKRKDDKVEVVQRLTKTPENRKTREWFPHDLKVFKKPMCLISTEGDNILKVEEETLKQIEKIDLPCCVVAVAGLYRTGKSYLMNRLAEAHSGFALGDTIESKTKGIWVWCKMHPDKKQTVLILLDTEGLGDVDKGDPKHDNRLFTLAALLSSTLVYNMKGAFDQDAVNKLTFVSEIANNIQIGGNKHVDNCGLKLFLPTFILVLRDFALKLVKQGQELTQDEYLEDCLKSNSKKGTSFNKPREAIRTYFPQRKCFTLPAPGDSDVVENLENLTFDKLSNKFQSRTVEFVSFVYSEDHKKLGIGKAVNGSMFADLTRQYIKTIKDGAVPDIDDTFRMVAKKENEKVSRKALEEFNKMMESIPIPAPLQELERRFLEAQLKSLDYLRASAVHDENNESEENAKEKMDLSFHEA